MADIAQRSVQMNIGSDSGNATRTVIINGYKTAYLSETGTGDGLLNMAKAGTLTTRTDDNTGVVTASSGHGIATSDKVAVFWAGGFRWGMTATVATNAITVDGGTGTNLPAQDTAVTICKETTIDDAWQTLDGDTVKAFMAKMPVRGHARFLQPNDTVIASSELLANEPYQFIEGDVNPFAGVDFAKLIVSSASLSTGSGSFRATAGY